MGRNNSFVMFKVDLSEFNFLIRPNGIKSADKSPEWRCFPLKNPAHSTRITEFFN